MEIFNIEKNLHPPIICCSVVFDGNVEFAKRENRAYWFDEALTHHDELKSRNKNNKFKKDKPWPDIAADERVYSHVQGEGQTGISGVF